MALKALLLAKKIADAKTELEALRAKDAEFETREAELAAAIEEASTEEEQSAVEEMANTYDSEHEAHETAKSSLEGEITRMETELEEMNKEPVRSTEPVNAVRKDEKTMAEINIRTLPMHVRAFDALPMERRNAIVEQDDVKTFLTRFREMRQARGVNGADLTVPVVMLDLIKDNMYRYSQLANHVRVENIKGEGRQTIAGTAPEAVWTEMTASINEVSFKFNQITVDGYKVAGYIPVANSILEDSDVSLAAFVIEMLSKSLGLAKDKAILYGKGSASKMPLGIVTRLAQETKPTDYEANAPEWVDLHTSNIVTIDDALTGAEFWAALAIASGNTKTDYNTGAMFWAMNSKTYTLLMSKLVTFTASGDITANINMTMPVIGGSIVILEFIPDGDIIGGYGELYLWAQRASVALDVSEHVQFIQDNTVYRGKERADGKPVIAGAFVAININGGTVTTSATFAGE